MEDENGDVNPDIIDREKHDSDEEYWFSLWCRDAADAGILEKWGHHPRPLILSEVAKHTVPKQLKTKIRYDERTLLQGAHYTADHIIKTKYTNNLWNGLVASPDGLFWIDVKPSFSKFNDAKYFSLVRKWVYDKHGIYINKLIPQKFFAKTFCPEELRFGKSGKELKKWIGCPTLEDYLD